MRRRLATTTKAGPRRPVRGLELGLATSRTLGVYITEWQTI